MKRNRTHRLSDSLEYPGNCRFILYCILRFQLWQFDSLKHKSCVKLAIQKPELHMEDVNSFKARMYEIQADITNKIDLKLSN